MENQKMSFDQFAESCTIDGKTLDSATVLRAIECDADYNRSEMLAWIADMIQAVRDGRDAARIAELAYFVADEYENITEMEMFQCDPVREIMDAAQCASLEETPIDQMGRA